MNKKILTEREQEVFELLVINKTTSEIAETLGISEKTVRNHISMLFKNWELKAEPKQL